MAETNLKRDDAWPAASASLHAILDCFSAVEARRRAGRRDLAGELRHTLAGRPRVFGAEALMFRFPSWRAAV